MTIRRAAALSAPLAIALAAFAGAPLATSRQQTPVAASRAAQQARQYAEIRSRCSRGATSVRCAAGRSIAVSGVKGRPKEAYFGAIGGGLWKTTDGGRPGRRSPMVSTSSSVGAVAVSQPTRTSCSSAWASRASAATSCPATASTSRPTPARPGHTSASRRSDAISRIRIHPTKPDIVFVASFGKYGAPSDERGVYKSTDGGKTWQRRRCSATPRPARVDLAIDRTQTRT